MCKNPYIQRLLNHHYNSFTLNTAELDFRFSRSRDMSWTWHQGVEKPSLAFTPMGLLFRKCEDKESVSYYRKHGALTTLLVNNSTFSPPSWQREAITSPINKLRNTMMMCQDKNCFSFDLNMSMMEVPENMVSSWRNWEKGAVRYLPPSCCFYKVVSPPDQSWFIGRGWGGGRQDSSHTSNVRQEQNR